MRASIKRIGIATFHGFKPDMWPGKKDDSVIGWMRDRVYISTLPDYANDLNAVYEVEKLLHKDEIKWKQYREELEKYYLINDTLPPSAAQKVEALVIVLDIKEPEANAA